MNDLKKEDIFHFIDPNDNDMLSKLSGNDLTDLLVLLDDYNLKLRDYLGFDKSVTFGLEIEVEKVKAYDIKNGIVKYFPSEEWCTSHDSSLNRGLEINSPVLRDSKKTWQDLNTICEIIKPNGIIDRKAGAHVHIGAHILGKEIDPWLNLFKLWSTYENIIYRFGYGTFLTARPQICEYAKPMSKDFWGEYEYLKDNCKVVWLAIKYVSLRRNQAVNFCNVSSAFIDKFCLGNTIEFRCPNGTVNSVIWQNNVNLFANLLLACKALPFDDLINRRHQMIANKYDELRWYDEIFIDQALEFADIVFKNNLDKIYFLKQYLKSFETCKEKNDYPNEKTKIKKLF